LGTADVVVVGGGVIGLASAWRLAQRGARVAIVDRDPGRGASWAAAGMLAPVTEVHHGEVPLLGLNLESARRYPAFVEELEDTAGIPTAYRPCGTLAVAADNDDHAALMELHRFQQRLGLEVAKLTRQECRQVEPALTPSIRGGIRVEGDHQIDPRRLVAALRRACLAAGVEFVAEMAASVSFSGGRVTAVVTQSTTVAAGAVVLAAGAWSSQLHGLPPELVPPVRPVKGQIIRLAGAHQAGALLSGNVRCLVAGRSVYLVPRADGEVVVGATTEEMGYDQRVTVEAVHDLLADSCAVVPGLMHLEFHEVCASLRPGSPDNAPLIGPSGLPGLIVATGHYRNGILLTPVTADAVVELISSGRLPERMAPFSPNRFGERVA